MQELRISVNNIVEARCDNNGVKVKKKKEKEKEKKKEPSRQYKRYLVADNPFSSNISGCPSDISG